jgi:hypothetical protein
MAKFVFYEVYSKLEIGSDIKKAKEERNEWLRTQISIKNIWNDYLKAL